MSCATVVSQIEVLPADDLGRRRHWTDEEKIRIVEESLRGYRQGSATARRYGLSRSLLTTWRFEGYGKSSDKFLENANEGMNEAINVALRDAGAKLVVKFGELPEIRERVEGR